MPARGERSGLFQKDLSEFYQLMTLTYKQIALSEYNRRNGLSCKVEVPKDTRQEYILHFDISTFTLLGQIITSYLLVMS